MSISFPQLAERLARHIRFEHLHRAVTDWLSVHGTASGIWAVACSGGADSVCLLLLLYAHFPQVRKKMTSLHFNHHFRGSASEGDEQFVRRLAAGLDCEIRVGHAVRTQATVRVSEAAARQDRLDFFNKALVEPRPLLFLGHHKNDIAETVLMRVARGSGTRGLAAPRPIQRFSDGSVRLRPLLNVTKAELMQALKQAAVVWREDRSNQDLHYFRNRVRHRLIPTWIEVSPTDILAGAARSRQLIEEDDAALEAWLDTLWVPAQDNEPLDLTPFTGKPRALFRRALHRWRLQKRLERSLQGQAFESLLQAVFSGSDFKMSCGPNRFLRFARGRLSLREVPAILRWASFALAEGAIGYLPGGATLQWKQVSLNKALREDIRAGRFDNRENAFVVIPQNEFKIVVRQWEYGDAYHPLGAPGTAKLQDLFTNQKRPIVERHRLPVICFADGTLVWCPGLPPADAFKINTCTQRALKLMYTFPFYLMPRSVR